MCSVQCALCSHPVCQASRVRSNAVGGAVAVHSDQSSHQCTQMDQQPPSEFIPPAHVSLSVHLIPTASLRCLSRHPRASPPAHQPFARHRLAAHRQKRDVSLWSPLTCPPDRVRQPTGADFAAKAFCWITTPKKVPTWSISWHPPKISRPPLLPNRPCSRRTPLATLRVQLVFSLTGHGMHPSPNFTPSPHPHQYLPCPIVTHSSCPAS